MSASKGQTAPAHTTPTLDIPSDIAHELVQLENLLRLTAFAVEARRVLGGIERAKSEFPEVKQRIEQLVDYSSQWTCHEDNTSSVLTAAADRLADILAKV